MFHAPARTTRARTDAPSAPIRAKAPAALLRATIEVCDTLAAARDAWDELEALSTASPYQAFAFAAAWFETIGAARGATPFIVVARDVAGRPTALLPLARRRRGPIVLAEFLGGKDANFNLGLLRPDLAWDRAALETLLSEAARLARPRVALYGLLNQPLTWQGAVNPLALLAGSASPSCAHLSPLPETFAVWLGEHRSKEGRKKLRRKEKRLSELGPITHRLAEDECEARRILAAFIRQKRGRMRALGRTAANAYDSPEAEAFLARLAEPSTPGGAAPLELHALSVGDRIVATFGALPHGERLSGLFVAFDDEAEIARCSPGEICCTRSFARPSRADFSAFDLGVGEARYKREICQIEEPLRDAFLAVTPLGRPAAWAYRARQALKGRIKRSPRLMALAQRVGGGAG